MHRTGNAAIRSIAGSRALTCDEAAADVYCGLRRGMPTEHFADYSSQDNVRSRDNQDENGTAIRMRAGGRENRNHCAEPGPAQALFDGAIRRVPCAAMLRKRQWRSRCQPSDQLCRQPRLNGTDNFGRSEDRSHRYLGSLQLFASEKTAGSRSLPQIFLPARRGCCRK